MIERYRRYRSYGHGRFIALGLAPHPEVVLAAAFIALFFGTATGVLF